MGSVGGGTLAHAGRRLVAVAAAEQKGPRRQVLLLEWIFSKEEQADDDVTVWPLHSRQRPMAPTAAKQ